MPNDFIEKKVQEIANAIWVGGSKITHNDLDEILSKLVNYALEEQRKETGEKLFNAKELVHYTSHDSNCKKVYYEPSAGRPTKDGGYEQYIMGKWYQVRPVDKSPKVKCNCGLDDLLNKIF